MVAEIFKELEELVARVELELLVRSIGIHETLKSWDGVSSMIANIGVRIVVQPFSHHIYGIGLIWPWIMLKLILGYGYSDLAAIIDAI